MFQVTGTGGTPRQSAWTWKKLSSSWHFLAPSAKLGTANFFVHVHQTQLRIIMTDAWPNRSLCGLAAAALFKTLSSQSCMHLLLYAFAVIRISPPFFTTSLVHWVCRLSEQHSCRISLEKQIHQSHKLHRKRWLAARDSWPFAKRSEVLVGQIHALLQSSKSLVQHINRSLIHASILQTSLIWLPKNNALFEDHHPRIDQFLKLAQRCAMSGLSTCYQNSGSFHSPNTGCRD